MVDPGSHDWHQAPDGQAFAFRPLASEPNPFIPAPRAAWEGQGWYEYPLDGFSSEKEMADRVLERLEPWFVIHREVLGTHCSGVRLRIDAILQPRDSHLWRDPDVAFGVEFKRPEGSGVKHYTGWIAQAVDYTHVEWDGYGRRIVLTCPGASALLGGVFSDRPEAPGVLMVTRRLMGQLGVGELVLRWTHGLTIVVNGGQIWSERYGVRNGRHWSLKPHSGSR